MRKRMPPTVTELLTLDSDGDRPTVPGIPVLVVCACFRGQTVDEECEACDGLGVHLGMVGRVAGKMKRVA